jgi:hypothetical protein
MPSLPSATPRPVRRILKRAKGVLVTLRSVAVRPAGPDEIRVSRLRGGWRRYRFDDPSAQCRVGAQALTVTLPDPAALARLSASGLFTGQIRRLTVRLHFAPDPVVAGVRPPRLSRTATEFTWRRDGGGLRLRMRWSQPYEVPRALRDAAGAVLRVRPLPQLSGPVYTMDRDAWLSGVAAWPQGHPAGGPPEVTLDPLGRPLGAFVPATGEHETRPLFAGAVNPIGRTLVGTAAAYQLVPGPGEPVLRSWGEHPDVRLAPGRIATDLHKYAVVSVDGGDLSPSIVDSLRALAACGVVFATADEAARERLGTCGLVAVADPAEVSDLRGYALSVEASRRMAVAGDALLRRTALGGDGALPLPTVSVVLSSMRPDDIEACLGHLSAQTYPAWEVVLGLHGYQVAPSTVERWRRLVPAPLRVLPLPAELTFGMVLGRLSRAADGELLTKVDDDDRYGAHHLTDLVIAWHASGADVVAKGSRFVYFPEADETIDRAWAAPELFQVTPAGGTMMLARGTLAEVGGWSHSPKHVDTDLLVRVKAGGGLVYRTHALEYVYVRRSAGHTWHTDLDTLREQGERVYPGLPEEILAPAYAPVMPEYSAK